MLTINVLFFHAIYYTVYVIQVRQYKENLSSSKTNLFSVSTDKRLYEGDHTKPRSWNLELFYIKFCFISEFYVLDNFVHQTLIKQYILVHYQPTAQKKTLPYANEHAVTDQLKFWPEVKN